MRSPPILLLLLAAAAATLTLAALPQGTAPPSAPAQYGLKNPWPGRYSPVAASHFTALPFVLGNSQGSGKRRGEEGKMGAWDGVG